MANGVIGEKVERRGMKLGKPKKKMSLRKKIVLWISVLVVAALVIPMGVTAFLYENYFGKRADGNNLLTRQSLADFTELTSEAVRFPSDQGQMLAGAVYSSTNGAEPKGLIVFSHGIWSSHEDYLEQINYFAQKGYRVFGFDNTGTEKSEGSSIYGLAQSSIDLDYALRFVEGQEELKKLPLLLYGHSWGGYAVCSVLNQNHKVTAVISRSGFNKSQDMLLEFGRRMYGDAVVAITPYLSVYEWFKFGSIVDLTGTRALQTTSAKVLVVHSDDDDTISVGNSLYGHREAYKDNANVSEQLLAGRGHDVVETAAARAYRKSRDEEWDALKKQYGGNVPEEVSDAFDAQEDKAKAKEMDTALMDQFTQFYDEAVGTAQPAA